MKYRISATLTFLTCPCHIPILLFLLSGTAAGAMLADNVWLVVAIIVPVFLYSAITAMLTFESKGANEKDPAKDAAGGNCPQPLIPS